MSQGCLHTVTNLPWPARIPDLSLIEQIWNHLGRRVGHHTSLNERETSPSGSNDSSGIVNDNLHDSAKSDLRVSLVDNGLVGPYSATVLVTLSSAPDHRPPRLESAR
ncbi:hypothetical protein TNCV_1783501 [Trichonephila clavipes]|nr:hypothetical protein TNCV_1783501 [Trichonephila clavipes]